jgi:hypothetical protein
MAIAAEVCNTVESTEPPLTVKQLKKVERVGIEESEEEQFELLQWSH